MKLMVIAPGHTFSTLDVYNGMVAGLRATGVDVIAYDTHQYLGVLNTLVSTTAQVQQLGRAQRDELQRFALWLSACDAVNTALDQQVDGVIVINGLLFPPDRAQLMHRALGIPVACYGTEAPYFDAHERAIAPFYSHWFTNERLSVGAFADLSNTCYLPHAWHPQLHQIADGDADHACDVVFVGGGFPERKTLLGGVDWSGIDLQLRGTLWQGEDDLQAGAIPNTETTAWHRSARVALNIHRTMTTIESKGVIAPGSAQSLGPRAYEIPAVGGFLLSDDSRPEIGEVYGDSAATYRFGDSADLERQVRYWLHHPDARERQRAAQREAIRPHSWTQRVQTVLTHLF